MTQEISIWRWAITDDLDALFGRMVNASSVEFVQIAAQLAQDGQEDQPDLAQVERETEARLRKMDLPEDVLNTMLKGFGSMMEEARQDEAGRLADIEGEQNVDPDGTVNVALACSHMFGEDPFLGMNTLEIDRQVAELLSKYRDCAEREIGNEGVSLTSFLGVSEAQLSERAAMEILITAGFSAAARLWVKQDWVFHLDHWQESPDLPIDIEFSRTPLALLLSVKGQLLEAKQI